MKTRKSIHWALYIIGVVTLLGLFVTPKVWMVLIAIGVILHIKKTLSNSNTSNQ